MTTEQIVMIIGISLFPLMVIGSLVIYFLTKKDTEGKDSEK